MAEDDQLERARSRAKAKVDFYVHLVIYVIVIGMLLGINLITGAGYLWAVWPAFFWGVALALHGASAFLISQKEAMIDRIARREIARNSTDDRTG